MPISPQQAAALRQFLETHAHKHTIDIIIIGAEHAGKRSLLERHDGGTFSSRPRAYDPTGDNYSTGRKVVTIQGAAQHTVMLQWDISTATENAAASPSQLLLARNADACLLVYDVGDRAGFEGLARVYDGGGGGVGAALRGGAESTQKPVMVVAAKVDLEADAWAVGAGEGRGFAERIGAGFVETSSVLGRGLDGMVEEVVGLVLLRRAGVA